MALIDSRDFFPSLRNNARYSLILPEAGASSAKAVLWLLPVRRGLCSDWVRYTSIELWAEAYGLAVVMPEGLSSDFADMAYGMRWWTYLTQELPDSLALVHGLPLDRSIAFGAEMGAIGAIKLGLALPGRYRAVGAVGEDFTRVSAYAAGNLISHDMEAVYGKLPVEESVLQSCDPLRMASACPKSGSELFLCHSDKGAETIARACGRNVLWCGSVPEGWEGRGLCLKEFLTRIMK